MKNKFLAVLLMMGLLSTKAVMASNVVLQIIDESSIGDNEIKVPRRPLIINIEDNVITMPAFAQDVTLILQDEAGNIVYSTIIMESTTSIILPSWLSGDFEILLYPEDSDYYFYGVISL